VPDWEHRACADPGRVARYWPSSSHNAGIACGPSGLVVVDLDTSPGDAPGRMEMIAPYGAARLAELCRQSGYALDTVHREFREEIGQDLTGARLLGVLENIFQWHDAAQHEIVFVFAAAFADDSAYEISEQEILDDTDGRTRVIWRPPDETSPPLYPVGVADLVARTG
jgi:hypothetical protein